MLAVPLVLRADMRLRDVVVLIGSIVFIATVFLAVPGWAVNAVVHDGDTIQLGDVTYRLDGIDAPELDQVCIDDHADPWSCGVEAREELSKLIGGRQVGCEDLGPDPAFRKRHIGVCTVAGETLSLNQQLIRQGFAVSPRSFVKVAFVSEQTTAQDNRRGLWKGCFANPQDFRIGKKDGTLLGGACRADRDGEIRAVLFPNNPAMPPSCNIKGKFAVRARVTGNIGIYHLRGCPSYAGLTGPDRWFCSEDDAKAAGFRAAYNCRTGRGK
jgi:endonuclease YncB( thermonuclease family)